MKGIAGYQWTLGEVKDVIMERFWTWVNLDGLDTDGYDYLGTDGCIKSGKYIWYELENIMWKKHRSVFQDHVKYIHNDILKPLRVRIIQYAERVCDMHDLEKYLLPPSMKGVVFE